MAKDANESAAVAFEALRHDIEQFDDHPFLDADSHGRLFSNRVPPYMKSYLVNWLRRFVEEHGDVVQEALKRDISTPTK